MQNNLDQNAGEFQLDIAGLKFTKSAFRLRYDWSKQLDSPRYEIFLRQPAEFKFKEYIQPIQKRLSFANLKL
jgi:hypothetical protein